MCVLTGLAAVATAGPAAAHTDLIQGSPGPGQRVGGDVDFVDLAFLDIVADATVTVTLDGTALPGAVTETDGRIIRFRFDTPLTTAGDYQVDYALTAGDGDVLEAGYTFQYDPASPAPQRIGSPPAHDDGPGTLVLIAGFALAAVVVGVAVVLIRNWLALRRLRQPAPTSGVADDRYP